MANNVTISKGLVSFEVRQIFEIINGSALSGFVCMFGIISNIINIAIFIKQGLDSTINISLFGLAISDLCGVLTLQVTNVCVNPLILNSGLPWDTQQLQYLIGAWPHLCFGHINCWITTYITAERCLCIALPLQVKRLITPRRTTMVISIIYIINVMSLIPEYSSAYFGWAFFPEKNRTLLTLVVRDNRAIMKPIGFFTFAFLGFACFPPVIFFTTVLVVKLRQQTTWRQRLVPDNKGIEHTSKREVKTVKMVVLIASVLIICYTPGVAASLTTIFVPSFNIVGADVNLYFIVWSFIALFEAINSSVNIFLYYNMSTNYQKTFTEMFLGRPGIFT